MNKKFKRLLIITFSLVFFLATFTPALASYKVPDFVDLPEQVPAVINYVALGDSGAAGVRAMPGQLPGWEEGSDYGYTDLIANWLYEVEGVIGRFNEEYSISGNTAAQLAVDTSTKDAGKLLKHADIVTITVGVNDFLQPLYAYFDYCIENELPLDINEALLALKAGIDYFDAGGDMELQANMEIILGNILDANPEAKIYVMGYYNPLPILIEMVNTEIEFFGGTIHILNDTALLLYQAGVLGMDYEVFVEWPPEQKISYLIFALDSLLNMPEIPPELQELQEFAAEAVAILSVVDLAPQVMKLNAVIEDAIEATEDAYSTDSIDFIKTLPIINGYNTETGLYEGTFGHMYAYAYNYLYADISNLLAPMADIHLTEAGYAAVAAAFEADIASDFGLS